MGSLPLITYVPTFSSISPALGSVSGGCVVNITGTGLSSTATVSVGGAACVVSATLSTPTALVCVVGPSLGGAGSFPVVYNGVATPLSFQYSSSYTPVVTTFSPTVVSTGISQVMMPR